ncbi:MAG: DUF2797 domain-containing protein [Candidatus Micrarchaeota archaeon]
MKHVLSFSSASARPRLSLREDGLNEELELCGEHYFSFSPSRACIGYKGDGDWHSCANRAMNVRQCPQCQYKDVARVYTVGDFSLYPHLHDTLSAEKYIIYLAQFGADITKVGLTRRSRLDARWREQGADFAAAILEFDGPDDAYPAEQLLQNSLDVVGAVRGTQKFKRLHFEREKAKAKLARAVQAIQSDVKFDSYRAECQITELAAHYPAVSNPEPVDFVGGRILGAKGAWLFFEGPSGQHYGVDMHSQVGHFVQEKAEGGMAQQIL